MRLIKWPTVVYLTRLPFVEYILYEGCNNEYLKKYPFMRSLDDLIESGLKVSEEELQMARSRVEPEHIAYLAYTSVLYLFISGTCTCNSNNLAGIQLGTQCTCR